MQPATSSSAAGAATSTDLSVPAAAAAAASASPFEFPATQVYARGQAEGASPAASQAGSEIDVSAKKTSNFIVQFFQKFANWCLEGVFALDDDVDAAQKEKALTAAEKSLKGKVTDFTKLVKDMYETSNTPTGTQNTKALRLARDIYQAILTSEAARNALVAPQAEAVGAASASAAQAPSDSSGTQEYADMSGRVDCLSFDEETQSIINAVINSVSGQDMTNGDVNMRTTVAAKSKAELDVFLSFAKEAVNYLASNDQATFEELAGKTPAACRISEFAFALVLDALKNKKTPKVEAEQEQQPAGALEKAAVAEDAESVGGEAPKSEESKKPMSTTVKVALVALTIITVAVVVLGFVFAPLTTGIIIGSVAGAALLAVAIHKIFKWATAPKVSPAEAAEAADIVEKAEYSYPADDEDAEQAAINEAAKVLEAGGKDLSKALKTLDEKIAARQEAILEQSKRMRTLGFRPEDSSDVDAEIAAGNVRLPLEAKTYIARVAALKALAKLQGKVAPEVLTKQPKEIRTQLGYTFSDNNRVFESQAQKDFKEPDLSTLEIADLGDCLKARDIITTMHMKLVAIAQATVADKQKALGQLEAEILTPKSKLAANEASLASTEDSDQRESLKADIQANKQAISGLEKEISKQGKIVAKAAAALEKVQAAAQAAGVKLQAQPAAGASSAAAAGNSSLSFNVPSAPQTRLATQGLNARGLLEKAASPATRGQGATSAASAAAARPPMDAAGQGAAAVGDD